MPPPRSTVTDEELADLLDGVNDVPLRDEEFVIRGDVRPPEEVVIRGSPGPAPPPPSVPDRLRGLAYVPENPLPTTREEADLRAAEALEAADAADRELQAEEDRRAAGLYSDRLAALGYYGDRPAPVPTEPTAPELHGTDYLAGAAPALTAPMAGYGGAIRDELARAAAGGTPTVPGVPAPALEMPGRTIDIGGGAPSVAGERRGRRGAPAPAPLSDDEMLIDALTERPRDEGPLFSENHETALDRRLGFGAEHATLATRRAESEAAGYAEAGDVMRGAERARAELENQRATAMGAARDRYRSALDFAASQTIDPEGWYHDRGTVGSIVAAISVALGSIGSGLGGGENQALSIINESIGRDLEAQRSRIDSANTRAAGEGTLLELLSNEFVSRDAALAASRAAMLEDVANRVAEEGAMLDVGEAGLAGRELHDQIIAEAQAAQAEAERAEMTAMLDLMMRQAEVRTATAEADRAERRAGGGTGAPSYAEPTEARMNAFNRIIDSGGTIEAASAATGLDPALAAGTGRFAEGSHDNNASNVAALSSALDAIERLAGTGDEDAPGVGLTGGLPWWMVSDEGSDLRAEIENSVDLLGRLRSGGAISEAEEARFARILQAAPTDRALRAGVERVRREVEARTVRRRDGDSLDDEVAAFLGGSARAVVEDDDDVAAAFDEEPGVNR